LKTTTSVAASKDFVEDTLWLNGAVEEGDNARLKQCISAMRELALLHGDPKGIANYKVHICSNNNFPTAAGLASSASGYACLAYALGCLFGLVDEGKEDRIAELSRVARVGSGSACRSLYGGFVEWEMGKLEDGLDSIAIQVAKETHWPDLHILVLVASSHKKATSSTAGMQRTVATSPLLQHRAQVIVPERMLQMKKAIVDKDFQNFALLTMQDSNQFHSVCLDTYPPIFYLNDTSRSVIQLVTQFNEKSKTGIRAAYTFDAGPNAVLYVQKENLVELLEGILHFFPSAPNQSASEYFSDPMSVLDKNKPTPDSLPEWYSSFGLTPNPGALKYILHTVPGSGPQILSSDHSLLNANGTPKA